MKLFFFIYAMLIPAVPLVGAELYKKQGDKRHSRVCLLLFITQLVISTLCILIYFKQ